MANLTVSRLVYNSLFQEGMEMTREESVAQHLRKHVGKTFCDDCIAESIGINRHQARNATAGLGVSSDFSREDGICSKCGKSKKVTKAY